MTPMGVIFRSAFTKVLARHDVKQRLSRGWGERERSDA
jgi:hypothetical protein